jgi:hypothetical protein
MSGTAADTTNDCLNQGAFTTCPADTTLTFPRTDGGTDVIILDASLSCPLDAVAKNDFITSSQNGLCDCAVKLTNSTAVAAGEPAEPVDCSCFACPQGSVIGFAFSCETEIYGVCKTFNCVGQCNGDLSLFATDETFSPTPSPTMIDGSGGSGASNSMQTSSMAMVIIPLIACVRMMRR